MSLAVKEYFNGAADDFDAIYSGSGPIWRWVNRHFRRDMYERYRLTFEASGDITNKTVLDIGCGGGRYSIEFAKRGAAQVVGLDFAPNMLEMATRHAKEQGVDSSCEFAIGDFMQIKFDQRFDVCVAMGVLDYIVDPLPFIERRKSVAGEQLIISFPSKSLIRTPIRKLRYKFKRCPVYFYDRPTIEGLMKNVGEYEIIKIPGQGMDYFVSAKVS